MARGLSELRLSGHKRQPIFVSDAFDTAILLLLNNARKRRKKVHIFFWHAGAACIIGRELKAEFLAKLAAGKRAFEVTQCRAQSLRSTVSKSFSRRD
jgi:hypothetical protein